MIRSNLGNLATKCVECPGHQNRVCHGKNEGIEFFGRVTLVGYRQQIDGMIAVKEGIRDFRYTQSVSFFEQVLDWLRLCCARNFLDNG